MTDWQGNFQSIIACAVLFFARFNDFSESDFKCMCVDENPHTPAMFLVIDFL